MEIKTYTINKHKIWKIKRVIELNNYKYCTSSGSMGLDLYHKTNNRKLRLSTFEAYEYILNDYNKYKDSTACYTPRDKNGNKFRDNKGKLLRIYIKDEYKDFDKKAYKNTYITMEDFHIIYEQFDMWNNMKGVNKELIMSSIYD